MADKMTKTTSSTSLDKPPVNMTKTTSPHMPSKGEAQIVTRLAENITESYRMGTLKQQKFNDLTNQQQCHHHQHLKRINNECNNNAKLSRATLKTPTDEWQEICSPKNKLKRKKTLSASLTSVTDSVNQEKRTRIEGMQLNCRGRLHIKENISHSTSGPTAGDSPNSSIATRSDRLVGKPPLPPSTKHNNIESRVTLNPPPRLKRKLQENVQTIQKLNALTEQLRLEINELKSSLTTEKGAVRVLRAQNECEARKWKNEVKRLQHAVELLKKAGVNKKYETTNTNNENSPQAAMGGLVNYEIQRLTNEINVLKEANKALEEKKVINCDADRRKAADIRELRDSYEIRLTQIQKSAKNEISRLLEEMKSKERNIGQLKKDLQILQNSKNTSRNATTLNFNQTTNNKATNSNAKYQTYKKPKSSSLNDANKQYEAATKDPLSNNETTNTPTNKDSRKKAENSSEISKLKNIELINNTKNVNTNLRKATKILNTHHNNEKEIEIFENNNDSAITIRHKHLRALERPDMDSDDSKNDYGGCMNGLPKPYEPLLLTTGTQTTDNATSTILTATATTQTPNLMTSSLACDATEHFDEQHITQELTQHLENKAIEHDKENHQRHLHRHHHHHHPHNSHSDSDSALSSAPTSISPQPPVNGEEPTDLWQTMRSYTHDIEKLQKEVDLLQRQNEQLKQELNVAKDQIIEFETNVMKSAKHPKISQLMERIKYLEEQEHHLQAEANDLRERNELLEFRILELEETNDKWSLQTHPNRTTESTGIVQTAAVTNATHNLWSCPRALSDSNKSDPFEMLFGSNSHTSMQLDSGIISPESQHHHLDDLIDITNEELCRRLGDLLKKPTLEADERHCLQQVLNLVQQLDALTPRSGPNSLNATSSSDEASSLDLVKSRVSDYSSASSTSTASARSACDSSIANATKVNISNPSNLSTPSRIVATVQPYNSTAQLAPHNTPTDSPRKVRCQPWQTNSLSESGVFVESDFYSDISENNVCTQTDFEDSGISNYSAHHAFNSPNKKLPLQQQNSANLSDQKRLQYYKDRVKVLEDKVLIYESSGDVQAKRLAERLQREIQLEKEVNELRDRVEFLESENSTLEEEKCEFEEAENDTRLRLQRLEVELEILSQRNVELEMSREALSAKYKDCHSECLILRDDLAASETQIRHLEEDKQKAKENLEFLHNTLPLLLICNTYCTLTQVHNQNYKIANVASVDMGNQSCHPTSPCSSRSLPDGIDNECPKTPEPSVCHERELQYLKDEVKYLRHQIKELNTRHYAAMESADSHWVDLEREYKEREEQFRAKEMCLKQKIQRLQDCLREDARSANEKICQLEEAEQGLKTCLVKVSKEHQKLQEDHELMTAEFDRFKEQHEQVREQQKPLIEALESEKKRNKCLIDELTFMRKLQQETECHSKKELECVRDQMFELKKDFLHIEVTNAELREEVATLECQIQCLEKVQQESEEKICCLTDEIRTKDEICQKLEKCLERSEGYCLADELSDTPSKRFKREDVKDLKTASKGLEQALKYMEECERMLPAEKQFKTIARDVKKLADTLLQDEAPRDENERNYENRSDVDNEVAGTSNSNNPNDSTLKVNREDYCNANMGVYMQPEDSLLKVINQDEDSCTNITVCMEPEECALKQNLRANSCSNITITTESEKCILKVVNKEKEEAGKNVTIGMSLVPQININENALASCSLKKTICEVPSELRKLAEPSKTVEATLDCHNNSKMQHKSNRIKRDKRCAKRRMTRGRVSNLHIKVNRMVSRLFCNLNLLQDTAVLSDIESEILQQNISYGSLHSIKGEAIENPAAATAACKKVDVSVECEMKTDRKDTATDTTCIDKCDCSIQVNDELAVELQIENIPKHIRCFLDLLKASNPNTEFYLNSSSLFNMKLYKCWQCDSQFRQGLGILATLPQFNTNISNCSSLESYEDFVSVMNCLHILVNLFKPFKIEVSRGRSPGPRGNQRRHDFSTATSSSSERTNCATTSEKSSKAYYDRNHQNIRKCCNKTYPSNSSQTSQEESQICAVMLKCPSSVVFEATECKRSYGCPMSQTLPNAKHKFTCHEFDATSSSSSSSLILQHFPAKLKLNAIERDRYRNQVRQLPKYIKQTAKPNRLSGCAAKQSNTCKEKYFSCSSDEDAERCQLPARLNYSRSQPKPDKNYAVLDLLHDVVHLIGEEATRITQVASTSFNAKCSKLTTQSCEAKDDLRDRNARQSPIVWSSAPCFHCTPDQASPLNFSFIQPYNLVPSVLPCEKNTDMLSRACSNAPSCCPHQSSSRKLIKMPDPLAACKKKVPCPRDCPSNQDPNRFERCPCLSKCNKGFGDSLMEYDDEEPAMAECVIDIGKDMYATCVDCLIEYDDEEPRMTDCLLNVDKEMYTSGLDCIKEYDDEEPGLGDGILNVDKNVCRYGEGRRPCGKYSDEEDSCLALSKSLKKPCGKNAFRSSLQKCTLCVKCSIKYDDEEEICIDLMPNQRKPCEKNALTSSLHKCTTPCSKSTLKYGDNDESCVDLCKKRKSPCEQNTLATSLQKCASACSPCSKSTLKFGDNDESCVDLCKKRKSPCEQNTLATSLQKCASACSPCSKSTLKFGDNDESCVDLCKTRKSPCEQNTLKTSLQKCASSCAPCSKSSLKYGDNDESCIEFTKNRKKPCDINNSTSSSLQKRTPCESSSTKYGDDGESCMDLYKSRKKPGEINHSTSSLQKYNKLPEYKQREKDCELAKEKIAESLKCKKRYEGQQGPYGSMALATLAEGEDEAITEEMKFFIHSLEMDLDAMDYARRKAQFQKNICKTKVELCPHDSFPVTITEVTDLGANSLYVKWIIHDCCGIDGYEIYTDGHLTNRYYNGGHTAAVITCVDVTLPHKIALVACANAKGIEDICNMNRDRCKRTSAVCKPDMGQNCNSYSTLWTPSIYLYDPVICRSTCAPNMVRSNF